MENVIALGKLIDLLFCSVPIYLFLTQGMTSPCNGNHFSSLIRFIADLPLGWLREHVQTIFGKINVIVTLRARPPPPPLNVTDFIS